jgi:hypothetical protein
VAKLSVNGKPDSVVIGQKNTLTRWS